MGWARESSSRIRGETPNNWKLENSGYEIITIRDKLEETTLKNNTSNGKCNVRLTFRIE